MPHALPWMLSGADGFDLLGVADGSSACCHVRDTPPVCLPTSDAVMRRSFAVLALMAALALLPELVGEER